MRKAPRTLVSLETILERLQTPPMWEWVQRATHGQLAAPALPGAAAVFSDTFDADGHGSANWDAGRVTAQLRWLEALHDRVDVIALGVKLPGCFNPRCPTLSGLQEAGVSTRLCSGCMVARYCSAACSKQHWRCHKVACRSAAAALAQQSGARQRAG